MQNLHNNGFTLVGTQAQTPASSIVDYFESDTNVLKFQLSGQWRAKNMPLPSNTLVVDSDIPPDNVVYFDDIETALNSVVDYTTLIVNGQHNLNNNVTINHPFTLVGWNDVSFQPQITCAGVTITLNNATMFKNIRFSGGVTIDSYGRLTLKNAAMYSTEISSINTIWALDGSIVSGVNPITLNSGADIRAYNSEFLGLDCIIVTAANSSINIFNCEFDASGTGIILQNSTVTVDIRNNGILSGTFAIDYTGGGTLTNQLITYNALQNGLNNITPLAGASNLVY